VVDKFELDVVKVATAIRKAAWHALHPIGGINTA
jgi:hypothetical protein